MAAEITYLALDSIGAKKIFLLHPLGEFAPFLTIFEPRGSAAVRQQVSAASVPSCTFGHRHLVAVKVWNKYILSTLIMVVDECKPCVICVKNEPAMVKTKKNKKKTKKQNKTIMHTVTVQVPVSHACNVFVDSILLFVNMHNLLAGIYRCALGVKETKRYSAIDHCCQELPNE